MRLSNKSTFSLICLVLLFAFTAISAMANTMSAEWSADLEIDTDTATAEPGWEVTLTYATAPGTTDAPVATDFTVTPSGIATVASFAPTASTDPVVTATDTVFTFDLRLADANPSADAEITLTDGTNPIGRRVTFTNGQDLASTSIYLPQLVSITAPKSSNGLFEATVTFAAPADPVEADTTNNVEAADGIGPATGIKASDISFTNAVDATVVSVIVDQDDSNVYKASILLTATTEVSLADAFPHVDAAATGDDSEDNSANVVFDNERPNIGAITFTRVGSNRVLDTSDVSEAFDINVADITDTPVGNFPTGVADLDLTVEFEVTPAARGAKVSNIGELNDTPNTWAATITPKSNTGTTDWPATNIRITVTVTDIAGNVATRYTEEVTLAPRRRASDPPGPGPQPTPNYQVSSITVVEGHTTNADTKTYIKAGKFVVDVGITTKSGQTAPTASEIALGSGFTTVEVTDTGTSAGQMFRVVAEPTGNEGELTISVNVKGAAAPLATGVTATMVTYDSGSPTFGTRANDTYVRAENGSLIMPTGGWGASGVPFIVVFQVNDANFHDSDTTTGGDEGVVDRLSFSTSPANKVKFGTPERLASGNNLYMVEVTPLRNPDPAQVSLSITIIAEDKAGNSNSDSISVSLAGGTPTPADDTTVPGVVDPVGPSYSDVITIPASSYIVVTNNSGGGTSQNANGRGLSNFGSAGSVIWEGMPNLYDLFNKDTVAGQGGRGAIILRRSVEHNNAAPNAINVGSVGISEIMWARDLGYLGQAKENSEQWIELHNYNAFEVKVILYSRTGVELVGNSNPKQIQDITIPGGSGNDSIVDNLTGYVIDVMTNFIGGDDDKNKAKNAGSATWDIVSDANKGSDGNSKKGIDFTSMARRQAHGRYNHVDTDGRWKGSWSKSTSVYLVRATDDPDAATDAVPVLYDYIGTPGYPNSTGSVGHIVSDTRTNVPSNTIVINEVANLSNANHEWIELKNVGTSSKNIKNYAITMVTDNNTETLLINLGTSFVGGEENLAPGDLLLLVAQDPKGDPDHPLAVGWNVAKDTFEQALGVNDNSPRYKEVTFEGSGLPTDGNFVLFLRRPQHDNGTGKHAKDYAKSADNVLDIAGYDTGLAKDDYSNDVSSTKLWPLKNFEAPASQRNKFGNNTVHYRQHNTTRDGRSGVGLADNGADNDGNAAFGNAYWTGLGYKRQAQRTTVNYGTPGYENGDFKNNDADIADGTVVISEMMLSQGAGRRALPQWLELYNTSKTRAVNLGAGWKIHIEVEADELKVIDFKAKGNVKTIPPLQTVLVVSGTARSAGGDFGVPPSILFPSTRVFNVHRELRNDNNAGFKGMGATDPILPGKFNLRLVDASGTTVDEIGNLDGNRRTRDTAAWSYPVTDPENLGAELTMDGYRSSLIRILEDGVPRNALKIGSDSVSDVNPLGGDPMNITKGKGIDPKYSWVHAADTEVVTVFEKHTWYGDETDWGTPGTRKGRVLPVQLSFFRPTLEDGQVVIRWTTESELDNAGFNIYRSEDRNGEFTQVNEQLIQGKGTTAERSNYKWVDTSAKPNVEYFYQIEDVSFAGERQTLRTTKMKGLISATDKLTTKWGELKEVQ